MNATETSPKVILSLTDYSVAYLPDAEDPDYLPYAVLDAEGEIADQWDTRTEAIEDAQAKQAEIDEERAEERREALREQIGDLTADVADEGTLRMVLALLKRAAK
jgi:hypothetical protein